MPLHERGILQVMIVEYIRCNDMKAGDILARTLYTDKNRILLRAGNCLTESSIRVIKQQGYKGIYIENELSDKRLPVSIPEPLLSDFESMCIIGLAKELISKTNIINDRNCPLFYTYRKKLEENVQEFVNLFFEYEQRGELLFETEDARTHSTWLFYHSLNTCLLSIGMAIKMGLDKKEVYEIGLGALFHDIGKMFIDRSLVNKINPSDSDRNILRTHCEHGKRLFQEQGYGIDTVYAIWQHHEHEDGSGYPNKLQSQLIRRSAKIVGLASAYDNMVNYNPFNSDTLLHQKDALEQLYGDVRFDSECVKALNAFVSLYPIGTKVKLSNGKEGLVIRNKAQQPLRPMVLCGRAEVLNLAEDPALLNVVIIN